MVKQQRKIEEFPRVRLGKPELVTEHTRTYDIKPRLSKNSIERIENGKPKIIPILSEEDYAIVGLGSGVRPNYKEYKKKRMIDLAKREFGITENCMRGGYMLENGEMLDFGNEKDVTEDWKQWQHDTIWAIYGEHTGIEPERSLDNYGEERIMDFLKQTNSIRMHSVRGGTLYANLIKGNNLTRKQWESLEYCCYITNATSLAIDIVEYKGDTVQWSPLEVSNEDCNELVKEMKYKLRRFNRENG